MTPMQPDTRPSRSEEQASRSASEPALLKSREVRLGLVLYGGVSLAVYINGVASEFFRAVRGRGIYRFIKALTDSDVAVDVISGTSAGGINGIFLAFCLCNEGSEFGRSARLWRQQGDIRRLLRKPSDKESFRSLLDSKGYYLPQLEEALADMHASSASTVHDEDRSLEDRSLVNELDLFITGTDVDGNVYTQFDDAGHSIYIKDHRSVFLLKHREGRKRHFLPRKPGAVETDDTVKALAKLACITSCFPSAFEPVNVPQDGAVSRSRGNGEEDRAGGLDDRLRLWGKLAQDRGRYFLDGGVLDNKPFTYTLRSIFSRLALCEVDRKLCYIEPVPESFKQRQSAAQPNILRALVASLIGIPRYESISEDLKMLADHNSRVQRYNRILSELQKGGGALPTEAAHPESPSSQQVLYQRSRFVALSERVLKGLLSARECDLREPDTRRRAAALVRCFDEVNTKDSDKELGVKHLFDDLDVTFRLRRLYHTVYFLHDFLFKNPNGVSLEGPEVKKYQLLWHVLNRQIELHEILQAEMGSLIDQAPIPWKDFDEADEEKGREHARELWHVVQSAFERLLDDSARPRLKLPEKYQPEAGWEWLSTNALEEFRERLKTHAGSILQELRQGAWSATRPTGRSLLHLFEKYEADILDHFIPAPADPAASVRRAYERFESTDTVLFPLELIGELREKDVIETIRISPRDAQKGFSQLDARKKLSGDRVGNFSGFFKRSWRANDILWGRLDGVCQLVEVLLTPERLEWITSHERLLDNVRKRLLKSPEAGSSPLRDEYDPARLFPLAGEETQRRLREWLQQLLKPGAKGQSNPALSRDRFLEMQNLLIEAAQLEVLGTELQNVLDDAREELATWKDQGLVRRREAESLESKVERMALRLEQSKAGDESTACSPADTALGRYFKEEYAVGAEELLSDIPPLVLLDIASAARPVLQNGLLGSLGGLTPGFPRGALRLGIQSAGFLTRAFLKFPRGVSLPIIKLALRRRRRRGTSVQALPEASSALPHQNFTAS